MEAVELGLREALFKDGRALLQRLYNQPDLSISDHTSRPGEKCHPDRAKDFQTLFGTITVRRDYFYHPQTQTGRFPLDQALGLVHSFSPGLVRLAARATAKEGYESASQDLLAQAGVALEGMRLIKDNLARAVKKGSDLDARGHMLMASTMGATAFQRGLGAIHALSHPFGGLYDAHHGTLNGIIMPYVVKANRRKIEKDIERAAAYLGIKGGFDGFLKWILALRKEIGIPHKLADIGIDTNRLDEVAAMAIKDPSAGGNPIAFTEKQYKSLAKRCVTGDL